VHRLKVLELAKKLTGNDRNKDYGAPKKNMAIIARYWTIFLQSQGIDIVIKPSWVPIMMVLVKIARMAGAYKIDNYVDGAAYIAMSPECREEDGDS